MPKILLKNGVTYIITDYAMQNSFTVLLDSLTVTEVLETLTEENLSEIQFMTDSGAVTGVYRNKLLCGYTDHGDALSVRINDTDLVRHGLTLDEDGRIVSAVPQRYAQEGAVIVDKLPDGDVTEYRYVGGEYIHDPLPTVEVEPVQSTEELLLEMAADHEYRLCLIELGVTDYDL